MATSYTADLDLDLSRLLEAVKFILELIYIELPQKQANLFQPYFKLGHDLIMSD